MTIEIRTFPVADGLTPEEAWDALDEQASFEAAGGIANALLVDGEFKGILPEDPKGADAMVDEYR